MSCERWLPLVLLAADDGLESLCSTEREDVRVHLADCSRCRQALADQRVVGAALRHRGDAPVPAGFAERVISRIDRTGGWVDLLRWRIWTYRLMPVAAVLLLLALGTAPDRSRSTTESELPTLAETWAFGVEGSETLPAFALLGQENVGGDVLLDVILSTEPDEPLAQGEAS